MSRCRHPKRMRVQLIDGTDGAWCTICQRRIAPARPGAGQPPVRGQPQRERLHLKLTEAELAEILAAAGNEPLGPWVVEAALRRARGGR